MTIISYLQRLQQSANPKSVLDIGANVGEFSHLCKSLWNDIDILMVEGNENCEPDLKLTGYPYTIELLGDEEKEVDFYIHNEMVHIADTKVATRFSDFFIRQMQKITEV